MSIIQKAIFTLQKSEVYCTKNTAADSLHSLHIKTLVSTCTFNFGNLHFFPQKLEYTLTTNFL